MDVLIKQFLEALEAENKDKALDLIMSKLEHNDIKIVELYTTVLAPALNNMQCKLEDQSICIWKEHVRSSIIRTILECCYPYVIKERGTNSNGKRVLIACPTEEYHEIGARMAADFFTLCGFQPTFVGSNTPTENFLAAIKISKPDYVVISVTNYYNLVAAGKLIERVKKDENFSGKLLVGGYAFKSNRDAVKQLGADEFVDSFEDIVKLSKEVHK